MIFRSQLQLGFAQAAIAAMVGFAVVLLARRRGVHFESEALAAMVRGIVQIVAVGSISSFCSCAVHDGPARFCWPR
jgi:putative ABC transport system permease protein